MTTPDDTTTVETRSVAEELLRRIGAGDPEHIAELYADGADWQLDWPEAEHGRAATPWIRHRSSRGDAADHYRSLAAHHLPEGAATTVDEVLVTGTDAILFGEIRQTAASTGRAYRSRFALRLTVENGLITRHHVYEDSLAVAQAFAPETTAA
ncbi:nuclear transport factor 2 family protein [Streptomyces hoynatensis]|uniref:Ketosteroid isomerase n=1 Tax=Streptomyces hoynatensis TaxID=1141874 RepID=A0A3A9Z3Z0_9ACTN|nr:nuclear transport factor 2 family protein [Streptomyces hoynatensis]RKN42993.1 ketosteroid isomerase [Streptomyces hoynatensis]